MAILSNYLAKSRIKKVAPFIHGAVLDLGCASGQILRNHSDTITHYTGIDYAEHFIQELKKKHAQHRFHTLNLDDDPLPFQEEFDCITMIAIVEHLFNQKHVFVQARKALKPGGKILITTPTVFGNDVAHRVGAALGFFAKSAVEDHIVIYNRKRFEILARESGLQLIKHELFQSGCNQFAILTKTAPSPLPRI